MNPAAGDVAGIFPRFVASLLDGIVAGVIAAVVFFVLAGVSQSGEGVLAAWVVAVFVYVLVFAFAWANGTSPGKFLLGQTVYVTDGQRAGFIRMLLRETIGKWVSGLVFGLGYIWAIFDENKQAWHDKLLSTIVVQRTAASQQYAGAAYAPQSDPQEMALPSPPAPAAAPPAPHRAQPYENRIQTVPTASTAMVPCAECGVEMRSDWRHCPTCGNAVSVAVNVSAPATPGATLVLMRDGQRVRSWSIRGATMIGRSATCDIVLEDPSKMISRQHARVEEKKGQYWLLDLQSANGTKVNGGLVTTHRLAVGDEIEIGSVCLRFQTGSEQA